MFVLIDPNSGIPTYRQLVDQLRLQIVSGRLATGSELPSTRTLSQQLGINPMTVSKAYGLLEEERLLTHRPGLPLTVAPLSWEALDRERVAQLRALLEPAALAARQLGLTSTRSIAVFREILSNLHAQED